MLILLNQKNLGNKVLNILKKNNIKLICLAGFMKILPAYFIKSTKEKLSIFIHHYYQSIKV